MPNRALETILVYESTRFGDRDRLAAKDPLCGDKRCIEQPYRRRGAIEVVFVFIELLSSVAARVVVR